MPARSLCLVLALLASVCPTAGGAEPPYEQLHPRLAFTRGEIPSLREKLRDGGEDDVAYAFIRKRVTLQYPTASLGELMGISYGLDFLLNLGLVAHIDESDGASAMDLGRRFALLLADSLAADDNTFYAPMRLRSLCYGYDTCMDGATPAERALVRAEIESYVDSLMFAFNFERWLHPPYTSNITAMIGSALGIAAICLANEIDPAQVAAILERADTFVDAWMRHHLDRDGTCFEGVQYGAWAMRHLAWYFEARRRYDGVDFSQRADIRRIEHWLAYEVLPRSGGVVNNLNDTAYLNHPLSRFNTYIEWALFRWHSGLASWLWERLLGSSDGYDWGDLADHPATALWHRPIAPVNPGDVLPRASLWKDRGLYYYRTGWPAHGSSDDIVFSFYSGEFHGGHSQEDQGSFTLFAYGARFAADNGFDRPNWASEAHNLVFVDGKGQHFSGTSVGTDGRIVRHLLTPHADYLFGDATSAYATHSPLNRPGFPFPDDDWSYGYFGDNPVERAYREWLVVHAGETPPYFVLLDDVKKDDVRRTYDWRMHTEMTHTVDLSANPVRIAGERGGVAIDVCHPAFDALGRTIQPFENPSTDPSTNVVTLSTHADSVFFALVLRPEGMTHTAPGVRTTSYSWGGIDVMAWPGGITDVVLANAGTGRVEAVPLLPGGRPLPISTDARILHLRLRNGEPARAVIARATHCDAGGIPLLRIENGPATVTITERDAYLDRADARFRLHAPGVLNVHAGDALLTFVRQGPYIERTTVIPSVTDAPVLRVYPHPSRGPTTLVVENSESGPVTIDVFDVAGRRVRSLYDGLLARGNTLVAFDGRDDLARPLSSGVYFARARAGGRTTTAKIVLVR